MKSRERKNRFSHYVRINPALCNGCVLCMKACPTKAIRVRGEKAHIEGACIDCGECIRVCPRGAIKAVTTGYDASKMKSNAILSVSPVFYAQFGDDVSPNDVLSALKKAFKHVYDQAASVVELFNLATEFYIQERRENQDETWPLISSVCPVVTRLIAYRFPSLLKNIIPIVPPREIAARELKRSLYGNPSFKSEEFGIYHVSPCSAKMISIKESVLLEASYLDGALGINEIYDVVKREFGKADKDVMPERFIGSGLGWGMSGGEIAGLESGRFLAVSGMQETIRYLEKIEMGLLSDIEYVEFRTCSEGCIGGPLTVTDKYQAKNTLQKFVKIFGVERRLDCAEVREAYEAGWFFIDKERVPLQDPSKGLSVDEALRRQEAVEKVYRLLPLKECGICGSPDCRTFAEDVVDGRAELSQCPLHSGGG
ncbi:MAG: [Fe-Fe] hydrogenase large subunit C-terminal domain-containing protein [Desulfatiglandales bacterium]